MKKPNTIFKYKPNLKKRIITTLLDYGLFLIGTIAYIFYFGEPDKEGGMRIQGISALLIPIVWFLYFIVVEASKGATFGHQALNLKVVTINRKPISFKHSVKRHLIDFIDIFFYGIPAIIAIKNSDKSQRIGDMWANTIVVDLNDDEQF